MTNEEYWYWLCNIEDMWNGKINSLIKRFKTPENIFFAGAEQLAASEETIIVENGEKKDQTLTPGVLKKRDIDKIINAQKENGYVRELEQLKNEGIKFIYPGHEEYPELLKNIPTKPYSLYVKGKLPENTSINIAVVGARACSEYGKSMAVLIAKELAMEGIGIISGMARGIDSMGHMGAIQAGGKTFAVLGSGLNNIYPPENTNTADKILESGGGIISEYPMNDAPLKWHFPLRNRLISGMSNGVLVVEAKERSGSLITVEYAAEQGKEVFAVPGRICDTLSQGCNRLIRSGACIVTTPKDILREIGVTPVNHYENQVDKNISLEKDLEVVYSGLSLLPQDVHSLIEETGFDVGKLTGILVKLQLMGLVSQPKKNYYSRK